MKELLENWQVITTISTALVAMVVSVLTFRRQVVSAVKEEAAVWERVANARSEEVRSLTTRVQALEQDIQGVRRENNELRNINLTLQRENIELQNKVTQLQGRIILLESMQQFRRPGDITTPDVG